MQSIGKIIKRVLLGLLLLIGAVVVIIGGLIVFEGATSPSSVENSNVSYTDSAGNPLHGYLARPEGEGPFPAVLMIHEWWGLTAEIPELAEALAAEGYIVLAPDAYRGEVTDQVPRALFLRLTTPQEQISADLDAAFEYLLAVDGVDPGRMASLGYCFGGEQSLLLLGGAAGLGHGDARASERRALDAREVLQRVLGVDVDVGGVESILDHTHQRVGEHAGLHVPADAGLAGVEQRPQLQRGLEGSERVLHAP